MIKIQSHRYIHIYFINLSQLKKKKMEGEIISTENIKPSSPTPHDKKTHNLSLLDQALAPVFIPVVLYYPNHSDNTPTTINNISTQNQSISHTTQILKESLSETLTRFFPLAGRVKDRLSIDCNDEGVLFKVARFINTDLSDYLKKPDPTSCRAHIPSEHTWTERGPGSHVAMIQVSFFRCGGFAIGSVFLHTVVDAASAGSFLKAWAAAGSGSGWLSPDYAARSLFPQNESLTRELHLQSATTPYFKKGRTAMRRYVFDGSAISRLRAEFEGLELGGRRPTRVELVSALMWKCFMAVSSSAGSKNPSAVSHVVNMRGKAEPPFPESSFGNFVWMVAATSNNSQADERDLKHLFGKVRKAIGKVDGDFVRRMQGDEGFSGYCENLQQSWNEFPENSDYLFISSWCGFGLYSVDFGFGKPMWISNCEAGGDTEWLTNVLWLVDTRDGNGIEAWLTLNEKYVAAFDEIQEIHDLASVDPSPFGSI